MKKEIARQEEKEIISGNARALPPGTVLDGKYLLGGVIGEGGFGITYMGTDLNLQLKVAVKEYFPASLASRNVLAGTGYDIHVIGGDIGALYWKGLEDYANEANRLAQFALQPGIVSVLNFFYENNTAYMVMEFVEGITLREYLRRHNERLPWQETLDLLHPVILSLIKVHNAGIIHRDISPDNIMISENGEMVLIDFGAARKMEGDQEKTVVLKRGYAPLEQYQTDGNQGTWSDVYSFCATIYRMISGVKAPDALAVMGGSAQIKPLKTLVKEVPEFLDRAVSLGMQNEISARIQSMEELEGYLYRGRHIKNRAGRKKAIAAALILVVVFFFVVAAGYALRQRQAKDITPEETLVLTDSDNGKPAEDTAETEGKESLETELETGTEPDPGQEEGENGEAAELDAAYENLTDTQELTYENIGNGLAITSVDYSITEVVIPGEIDGQQVKELRGMSPNAVSVVIKNGIEKITAGAFRNCVYLESVYIPASVTQIDDSAFEHCLLLTDIIVSENNDHFYAEDGKLYRKDGTLLFGQ